MNESNPPSTPVSRRTGLSSWFAYYKADLPLYLLTLVGVGFACVLCFGIHHIFTAVGINSDSVAPYFLSPIIFSSGHGVVYLSDHQLYTVYLVDFLISHLSAYRQLYWALPYTIWVATLLVLAGTVRKLAGWRPAIAAFFLGLLASSALLYAELSPADRYVSNFMTVLLPVYALWVLSSQSSHYWRYAASLALGALMGLAIASDSLLVFTAFLPFLFTVMAVQYRRPSPHHSYLLRCSLLMLPTAILTYLGAFLWAWQTNLVGVIPTLQGFSVVPNDLSVLGQSALAIFGGLVPLNWKTSFSLLALFLGLAMVISTLFFWIKVLIRAQPSSQENQVTTPVYLFSLYWLSAALASLGIFLVTAVPQNTSAVRYLFSFVLAIPALASLNFFAPKQRSASPTQVCPKLKLKWVFSLFALAVATLDSVSVLTYSTNQMPSISDQNQVVSLLQKDHIQVAYGDYWYANTISYLTNGQIKVQPLTPCPTSNQKECLNTFNIPASWLNLQTGTPIAVIINPETPSIGSLPSFSTKEYGGPQTIVHLQTTIIYIYNSPLSFPLAH